jgi:hypothetical protein
MVAVAGGGCRIYSPLSSHLGGINLSAIDSCGEAHTPTHSPRNERAALCFLSSVSALEHSLHPREAEKSAAREKEETDTHATDGESTSGCRAESDVFAAATSARSSDAMIDEPEIELLLVVFDLENMIIIWAFLNGAIRLCVPYFPRPHFQCDLFAF